MRTASVENFINKCLLFLLLAFFIILVNYPLIFADLMYVEQPILYSANQTIHSLHDLLQIYLHPQLLDLAVPFFRPSGHFLLYQLITPIIGWHNTRGFLIVNFILLAASCYLLIRLYEKLFPGFKVGAYVAAALYVMQPGLMQSRITVMHFEFAYVACLLLALNYFVTFCQRNQAALSGKFANISLLMLSLIFFIFAVTFKEPALMLGPVMVSYFFITYYESSLFATAARIVSHRQALQIVTIITLLTLALCIYLTLSWQVAAYPLRDGVKSREIVGSLKATVFFLLNLPRTLPIFPKITFNAALLAADVQPHFIVRMVDWTLLLGLLFTLARLPRLYRRSVIFLVIALALFAVLPVLWAVGMPWHLSLSLLCLNLLMGFSFEFIARRWLGTGQRLLTVGVVLALPIGGMAIPVDKNYLQFIKNTPALQVFSALDHNAVLHPPLRNLPKDSVLVVEDSTDINDYNLGNTMFTYSLFLNSADYPANEFRERNVFIKHNPHYNGTLFRWAYLNPALREEVVPFKIAEMHNLVDSAIYSWLENYDNIFCYGYDKNMQWQDRTAEFKKNLLTEKIRRHMVVNSYKKLPTSVAGHIATRMMLPYGDAMLCRQSCDNVRTCQGFTYLHLAENGRSASRCDFYDGTMTASAKTCLHCESFFKSERA